MGRRAAQLAAEERERLHRAHQRLRNASSALEALVATEPLKGRWDPQPATDEALDGARGDLERAYRELSRAHVELLGWSPLAGQ